MELIFPRWLLLAAGVLLFAALMAVRAEVASVWLRALLAGGAFVVLGLALYRRRV